MTTVVEWAPFTLRQGIEESQLFAQSQRLQDEFLRHQDGFLRRELLRRGERSYVDLVWWKSRAAAEAAMANVEASQACRAYFDLMPAAEGDAGTGVLHLDALRAYPG